MFNFPILAEHLTKNKLGNKAFFNLTEAEINDVCHAVIASINDNAGYTVPYIKDDVLVLPVNIHPQFKYWENGQSLLKTLQGMDANAEIIEKYCPAQDREGLKR